MPRTYIRKTVTTYSRENINEALNEIHNNKCSINITAKKYGIPFDTPRRWVVKPPTHIGSGRNTFLTEVEEQYIVHAMQFTASCDYPFDRCDLVNVVQSYFESSCKIYPFPNNPPGQDWIRNFERCWEKELGKRKPEILTKSRAQSLDKVVDNFFKMYANVLDENNLWDQPHRSFNVDETGLSTNPISSKVYVEKKIPQCIYGVATSGKTMYTVLFCVSVTGYYMSPLTVYKDKNVYDTWTKGGPTEAVYAASPSGWMEGNIFEKWFEQFIENVNKLQLELPVLLIYDGHSSHLTYDTVKRGIDNQVIILCLPPNTSHAIQPLDVGVFGPLKLCWKKILKDWYRESRMKYATSPKTTNSIFMRTLLN